MTATAIIDLRTAMETHAANCRRAMADMRPRPDLPVELRARLRAEPAYLADANLSGANLAGAKGIVDAMSISPIGSRRATLTATKGEDGTVTLMTGCFRGSLDDFVARVNSEHGDNDHSRAYRLAVDLIRLRFAVKGAAQ